MRQTRKHGISLALGLALAVGLGCDPEPEARDISEEHRIVGGHSVDVRSVPWQAVVRTVRGGACGGVILDTEWIATAAHCVDNVDASQIYVWTGISTRDEMNDVALARPVTSRIIHEDFSPTVLNDDIAILRLAEPLDLTDPTMAAIRPVTEEYEEYAQPGELAVVSGLGRLGHRGARAQELQWVVVPILADARGVEAYGSSRYSGQIVAGNWDEGGQDSCQGDSGGPLVVDSPDGPLLAGLVSWGWGCAQARRPGMYTRISDYVDWIDVHATVSDDPLAMFPCDDPFTVAVEECVSEGPPPLTGRSYMVSIHEDFFTDTDQYATTSDTLHLKLWDEQLDPSRLQIARFRIQGRTHDGSILDLEGGLEPQPDGSYVGSAELDVFRPTGQWLLVFAELADDDGNGYVLGGSGYQVWLSQ